MCVRATKTVKTKLLFLIAEYVQHFDTPSTNGWTLLTNITFSHLSLGSQNNRHDCVKNVDVFFSHLFWTSRSSGLPAGATQEEGHTECIIHLPSAERALIFSARRIQPFLSLVDREVEFCPWSHCLCSWNSYVPLTQLSSDSRALWSRVMLRIAKHTK